MRVTAGIAWGVAVLLFAVPLAFSYAAEFKTGNEASLAAGESSSGDLYLLGGTVTSAGSVKGDVTALGGTILVSGPVSSDALVGGGNVTIIGDIGDDIRASGGNLLIQAPVKGDVIAGGGQVTIGGRGVGGDVIAAGGSVNISAPIGGTVMIVGGQVRIDAPIAGNVHVQAEKLTLGPKAAVSGDLTYTATEEFTKEDGASVKGHVQFTKRADVRDAAKFGVRALLSLWVVSKFFMLLAGSFIVSIVFNRYSHELVQRATTAPLFEMLRGIIFLIVTPVISLVLLATVIGIPFGALGLIAFVGALIFVFLVSPIVIGSVVHKWVFKPTLYEITWKTIVLGVVVSYALDFVPIFGGIIKSLIALVVLGAALSIKWSAVSEWR